MVVAKQGDERASALTHQLDLLRRHISSLTTSHSNSAEKEQALNAEISKLQERLAAALRAHDQERWRVEELQTNNAQLRSQLENAQRSNKQLRQEIEEMREHADRFESNLAHLRGQVKASELQQAELEAQQQELTQARQRTSEREAQANAQYEAAVVAMRDVRAHAQQLKFMKGEYAQRLSDVASSAKLRHHAATERSAAIDTDEQLAPVYAHRKPQQIEKIEGSGQHATSPPTINANRASSKTTSERQPADMAYLKQLMEENNALRKQVISYEEESRSMGVRYAEALTRITPLELKVDHLKTRLYTHRASSKTSDRSSRRRHGQTSRERRARDKNSTEPHSSRQRRSHRQPTAHVAADHELPSRPRSISPAIAANSHRNGQGSFDSRSRTTYNMKHASRSRSTSRSRAVSHRSLSHGRAVERAVQQQVQEVPRHVYIRQDRPLETMRSRASFPPTHEAAVHHSRVTVVRSVDAATSPVKTIQPSPAASGHRATEDGQQNHGQWVLEQFTTAHEPVQRNQSTQAQLGLMMDYELYGATGNAMRSQRDVYDGLATGDDERRIPSTQKERLSREETASMQPANSPPVTDGGRPTDVSYVPEPTADTPQMSTTQIMAQRSGIMESMHRGVDTPQRGSDPAAHSPAQPSPHTTTKDPAAAVRERVSVAHSPVAAVDAMATPTAQHLHSFGDADWSTVVGSPAQAPGHMGLDEFDEDMHSTPMPAMREHQHPGSVHTAASRARPAASDSAVRSTGQLVRVRPTQHRPGLDTVSQHIRMLSASTADDMADERHDAMSADEPSTTPRRKLVADTDEQAMDHESVSRLASPVPAKPSMKGRTSTWVNEGAATRTYYYSAKPDQAAAGAAEQDQPLAASGMGLRRTTYRSASQAAARQDAIAKSAVAQGQQQEHTGQTKRYTMTTSAATPLARSDDAYTNTPAMQRPSHAPVH